MFSTQSLSCLRGDRELFSGIDLRLACGGLLYILGENGAGKSSLLRILTGLMLPESGTVYWHDQDIQQDMETYRSHLRYIGHLNAIKEDLSAEENLMFTSGLYSQTAKPAQVLHALHAVNLHRQAHLPTRHLSQGQKRRVALARLWLDTTNPSSDQDSYPHLWILDEPFAALDTEMTQVLAAHISQHLAHGGMAILTTHQPVTIHAHDIQTYRLQP
jgi:heme exporter protein A